LAGAGPMIAARQVPIVIRGVDPLHRMDKGRF